MFKFLYETSKTGVKYLVEGALLTKKTGAEFAKPSQYTDYLSSYNKGLLIDGYNLKLDEKRSFQNVCVIASPGAGKTTRYIIPNVLEQAKNRTSIVVNDPKGEVFKYTSQYMKDRGYNVIIIDPENIESSSLFNPLLEAKTDIELEQVSEILMAAGNPRTGNDDPIWANGAKRFLNLFLKCLKNASLYDPDIMNLSNINLLFQYFGEDGSNIEKWIVANSVIPNDLKDPRLYNEWMGLLTGNPEAVQGFVLNAMTALKALSNPNIAKLTAKTDIDLESIRKQKTIIYFITPPQHMGYYSFLTSLFFRSVFNSCMRRTYVKGRDLPVYILYDEFGHSTIPNFVETCNTIRGYGVSLSIVLQSISQLNVKYGKETANAIQGGFSTSVTYSGSDPATTSLFEVLAGKVRERQRSKIEDVKTTIDEYNLMNASDVRTIREDQLLLVSTNNNPVLLNCKPYYEVSKYNRMVKNGKLNMPIYAKQAPKYIEL